MNLSSHAGKWIAITMTTVALTVHPPQAQAGEAAFHRITLGSGGVQSRGDTKMLQVSSDGRCVYFSNDGDNMLENLPKGLHYYWKDLQADRMSLIDPPPDGDGKPLSFDSVLLCRDGHCLIALQLDAAAHRAGAKRMVVMRIDTEGKAKTSILDIRRDGILIRPTFVLACASSGDYVVCEATAGSTGPDTPRADDYGIYLVNTRSGKATFIAKGDGTATISDDGSRVAFSTNQSLSKKDTNSVADIYLFARQGDGAGAIRRVSVSQKGIEGNAPSNGPKISGDGRFIVFVTQATNLTTTPLLPNRDHWLVADTSNDAISPLPENEQYFAYLDGPAVLTSGSALHITSLVDSISKPVNLASLGAKGPDSIAMMPHAISSDGKRLFFVTVAALEERDTNRKSDAYYLDLAEPIGSVAESTPPPTPPVAANPPIVAPPPIVTPQPSPRPAEQPRTGVNNNFQPLDDAVLKRIAGQYQLTGRDATGGDVSDELTLNADGTANLQTAKALGIDSLKMAGQDRGMILVVMAEGIKDSIDVQVTLIFQSGNPVQCIVVQKQGNNVQRFYQLTVQKKNS